ncbi:MAG: hypothetical protein GXP49_10070 [Deltaproteobacteria bacterium]|nr:hypothetical protein [Deltaproteobacteria bacterium]
MRKYSPLTLMLCIVIAGCGGGQKKSDKPAGVANTGTTNRKVQLHAKHPSWVDAVPRDSRSFQGVAEASERQTAQDNALRNLAASIKVKIKGETKSVYKETGGLDGEDYEDSVETMVDTTLSGVKYDLWQDPGTKKWWAHAYLSKAVFWKPRDEARKIATAYFKRAIESRKQGRFVEGLKLLIQSMAALGKYWALPFDVDTKMGKKIFLLATEDELMSLARDTRFDALTGPVVAKVGSPVKQPLKLEARMGNRKIAGLPIHFYFKSCKGKVESSIQTNENGVAAARVVNFLGGARRCAVEASLDLDVLLGGLDTDEATRKRLASSLRRVGFPVVVFPLSTQKMNAAVVIIDQEADGKLLGESQLQGSLIEALRQDGYRVTTRVPRLTSEEVESLLQGDGSPLDRFKKKKLDLLVVGRVLIKVKEGSSGTDVYGLGKTGLVVARGRILVQAMDVSTGSVLAKVDRSGINGRGFSRDKAISEARRAACKTTKSLIKKVNEHFLN